MTEFAGPSHPYSGQWTFEANPFPAPIFIGTGSFTVASSARDFHTIPFYFRDYRKTRHLFDEVNKELLAKVVKKALSRKN